MRWPVVLFVLVAGCFATDDPGGPDDGTSVPSEDLAGRTVKDGPDDDERDDEEGDAGGEDGSTATPDDGVPAPPWQLHVSGDRTVEMRASWDEGPLECRLHTNVTMERGPTVSAVHLLEIYIDGELFFLGDIAFNQGRQ